MKVDKSYYAQLRSLPSFSYVRSDEDLAWLLNCIDGELIPSDSVPVPEDKSFWDDGGFLYQKLPETGKILRVKSLRAGKLCSYQCKFHRDLIDFIAEYETGEKFR